MPVGPGVPAGNPQSALAGLGVPAGLGVRDGAPQEALTDDEASGFRATLRGRVGQQSSILRGASLDRRSSPLGRGPRVPSASPKGRITGRGAGLHPEGRGACAGVPRW